MKENEPFFGSLDAFMPLPNSLGFFLANADLIAPMIKEPYLTKQKKKESLHQSTYLISKGKLSVSIVHNQKKSISCAMCFFEFP